jgi:hypothetical protein
MQRYLYKLKMRLKKDELWIGKGFEKDATSLIYSEMENR